MKSIEKIQQIKLSELKPFNNHPFKIRQDDEMAQITESIKEYGVITPALARPMPEGGYELISGHRRMEACKSLGIDTIPVIIREMSDTEAVITMADSNLQRENVLPSEKAFAYKMKLEALKHQGKSTCGQVVHKSRDELSGNESGRQIQRYIRLTHLIPELLQLVDENRIAFTPAVEVSYLSENEQQSLYHSIQSEECTPSLSQAQRMKRLSQDGALTKDNIFQIMSEEKPNQKEKLSFKTEDLRGYFPKNYTPQQMQNTILKLLESWRKRQRDKGSR